LEAVRVQPVQEAVHQLTPAPEAVATGAAHLGQTCHRPLERVAVQVTHPRQYRPQGVITVAPRCVGADRGDPPAHALDAHIACPALRQQRLRGMETGCLGGGVRNHWTLSGYRTYCIYKYNRKLHMRCDTLWHNAHLMTLDDTTGGLGIIGDGVVAALDGRIVHTGPAATASEFEAAERVDCGGRWISPGLIDCHTHL